jgi:2-oxoglutarate dehydrogenase E2 component (dihydrolipoamide succinyltransferase)
MSVDLKVPEMGEAVSEVYIGQWQKKEGDRVEVDDALVEIESDKATLDLRAPLAGVLTKILKRSGEQAEVGEVIGQIDDGATAATPQPAESKKAREKPDEKPEPKVEKKEESSNGREAKKAEERAEERTAKPARAEMEVKSPAQKQADEVEGRDSEERPVATQTEKLGKQEKPKESTAETRVSPRTAADSGEETEREKRVPMSPIRRRIASRLVEAQQNAALLTTFNEVDMSAVKSMRAELGESFEKRHKVRLGFMSFFVKAAVDALRQCREINAMIDGDEIVYREFYDIGVAISTDKGLVVPILRDADRLSFAQIEQAIVDFADRARSGALKVDELQGGTFTITNGGVFGSLLSTPLVNPPQSGVLGMHTIQDRPVAIEGQVVIRPMMYVALTYDHRIVDGREAVTFLRRIKESVEEPARLLIEV